MDTVPCKMCKNQIDLKEILVVRNRWICAPCNALPDLSQDNVRSASIINVLTHAPYVGLSDTASTSCLDINARIATWHPNAYMDEPERTACRAGGDKHASISPARKIAEYAVRLLLKPRDIELKKGAMHPIAFSLPRV